MNKYVIEEEDNSTARILIFMTFSKIDYFDLYAIYILEKNK